MPPELVPSPLTEPPPSDPPEVEELLRGMSGRLAFDVGANVGQSTGILVARFAKVVAFEPAVESASELRSRYEGDPRVDVMGVAVGAVDGTVCLEVRVAAMQSGQLVAAGMPYRGEHAGEPGMQNWGDALSLREVDCMRLDSVAAVTGLPDWVKVDTEGGEVGVLFGSARILTARRTRWLVEWHTAGRRVRCARLFREHGYTVRSVLNSRYARGSHMRRNHGWMVAVPGRS